MPAANPFGPRRHKDLIGKAGNWQPQCYNPIQAFYLIETFE
jgi:hypothetical protein